MATDWRMGESRECPECGTYSKTHIEDCPYAGRETKGPQRVSKAGFLTKEQRIARLQRELNHARSRITHFEEQIAKIEAEPDDTYEDGTYILLERAGGWGNTGQVNLYRKIEGKWWNASGAPVSWADILGMYARGEDSVAWRVLEMVDLHTEE